ncbi:MAG: outer membrane beta-barrel protein [Saprospiraceae bacterium]
MHHILGKKIIAITAALFFVINAQAQIRGTYNYLDFAQKPYYFGITLAYNSANYKLAHSNDFILNDSITLAESTTGGGFNLGIVTNLKIGKNFDFRFLPTLSFANRTLEYWTVENLPVNKRIESVFVELPFHLRYKSDPYKDLRLFIIGGAKYSFDVASNSRSRNSNELVRVAPSDFALELGVGLQIFFPYFIFSPEIKVSHGLSNTLLYNDKLSYSSVLEKVQSRAITISFHFEG